VAPVLPEVNRDAVGPGFLAQTGGGHRVRFLGAARLPDGGNMIDVDVEAHENRLLGVLDYCRLLGLKFTPSNAIPQSAHRAGLLLGAALLVGCGGSSHVAPAEPQAAVRSFMNAVKANSVTAMGELWGTARGPAIANMKREEMEQRLTVIRAYLSHDRFEFVERNAPDPAGGQQRTLDVRIFRGNCQPVVPFTVVGWRGGLAGPGHRPGGGREPGPSLPAARIPARDPAARKPNSLIRC
jgi:hypothetical protein